MSYAWRQLQSAIRVLATTGDHRDRLQGAMGKLIKLKPRDLPSEVADDFTMLVGGISRFPARNITHEIKAAVEMLTESEVIEAIDRIMRMYDAVATYQPRPVKYPGGPRRHDPRLVPALHILGIAQGV